MTNRIAAFQPGLALGALLLMVGIGACSKSPTAPTPASTVPTLSQIQTQIFDVSCTSCHTDVGRTPSSGMNLKAGSAFAALVNVPSVAKAGAVRVIPGNPNGSYLIQKLEGDPGIVGLRMPRTGPPHLPEAQVKMIRDWIAAGAPNS
jgi:hypothetical protein